MNPLATESTPLDYTHFGAVNAALPDWREHAETTDGDPDDEQLRETPADVVAALGFDPAEFATEEGASSPPAMSAPESDSGAARGRLTMV